MNIENSSKLNLDERVQLIRRGRWIGYERAKTILDQFNELVHYPKVTRMPSALLVGEPNNGKTMLLEAFVKQYPAKEKSDGQGVYAPVIMIEAPEQPSVNGLYTAILEKVFAPYKPSDKTDKKKFQVIETLKKLNTKVLVIDEIHNILAGTEKNTKQVQNAIKGLSNQLKMPIIGAGTEDAFNAIQSDSQLSSRFEPLILPKWKLNRDYLRLLASFEASLPLKEKSELISKNIATKILAMSEGNLGEISTILNRAAIYALKNGLERIDIESLNSIQYQSPSDRKRIRLDV